MKAGFLKRLGAYIIDILIVSIIFTLITINITNDKLDNLNKEYNEAMYEFSALIYGVDNTTNEIATDDNNVEEDYDALTTKIIDLQYDIQKESILDNSIYLLILVVYFVIFEFWNKGQTIGKKLFGLKVTADKGKLKFWMVLVRNIIIQGIFVTLVSLVIINLVSKDIYLEITNSLSILQSLFIVVSALMILYRKDKRGLHDMMARCTVVEERGK